MVIPVYSSVSTECQVLDGRDCHCSMIQVPRSDLCLCGETQTMSHIVESCPLTKLNGGLSRLHPVDEDAVSLLTSYGS